MTKVSGCMKNSSQILKNYFSLIFKLSDDDHKGSDYELVSRNGSETNEN